MRIVAGIQARMGSTRFPGKSAANLAGKMVVEHVVDRARKLDVDDIVLLTTCLPEDNVLADWAEKRGTDFIREDFHPLQCFYWYYKMAKIYEADYVVRICGDAPFFDYKTMNIIIKYLRLHILGSDTVYLSQKIGEIWGIMHRSGMATEIIKADHIYKIMEHTTWGLHNSGNSHRFGLNLDPQYFNWKCSVDTPKDLETCQYVMDHLGRAPFDYLEIDSVLPDNMKIDGDELEQKYK
jgi:spore coat polysaccharide biosynthesis protein SpsF